MKIYTTTQSRNRDSFIPMMKKSLLLGICALLAGCNTLGTLASQFGETPLPPRVARQLYGLCRDCTRHGALPGCETCIVVQQKRRMLAGTPARQITPELEAFVRSEERGSFQNSPRGDSAPRRAVWIREDPEPPQRRTASTSSRMAQKPDSVPLPTPTPGSRAAFLNPDSASTPNPTPRPKRKPDGFDVLGYGNN